MVMMVGVPRMLLLPLLGCVLLADQVHAFVPCTIIRPNDIRVQQAETTSDSGIVSDTYASSTSRSSSNALKVIFSDVDGALIHYPKTEDEMERATSAGDNQILALPPSATGMRGIISSETLATCRDLRRKGVKLVLVSGMRTSTLLNRLPYLPRADAYCTEAGGRIFYPTEGIPIEEYDEDFFQQWTPQDFVGAEPEDLEPFGLREDFKWRERLELEEAAGKDGYAGNEVSSNRCEGMDDDEECPIEYENPYGFPIQEDVVPVGERKGTLWDFARQLQQNEGFVLDTKSYSTCFRVNVKHQTEAVREKFQALLNGDIGHPSELGKSTNLGCIDFYPISSGKRNCCKYIAETLEIDISSESVCVCDDDNDIEMALATSHAYIPALTSQSMEDTIRENPTKFTQTYQKDRVTSTSATDAALRLIKEEFDSEPS